MKPNTVSDATQFKVTYIDCNGSDDIKQKEKTFKTQKIMEQWIGRNDFFFRLIINRFALIRNQWEAFTTIEKRTVTLSELKRIIEQLEDEGLKSSKNEK